MEFEDRVAEQIARLPPLMKDLIDQQLAAGNKFIDIEIGPDQRVVLVMNHPFGYSPPQLPAGISYRETTQRDLTIFGFYSADEKWALVTVKFKPMVLEPIHGPPDPMPAHLEQMRKQQEKEEKEAQARAENQPPSSPVQADPPLGDAAKQFLGSMNVTYEMWHDGTGYDLDALAKVPADQLQAIELKLLNHRPVDWRDIEALARIDSPTARAAVVAALKNSDPQVRREAMNHAAAEVDPTEREQLLLKNLRSDDVFGGLSTAIDEAAEFHPPAVIKLLLKGTKHRPGQTAVLFAGLLYFIHGKSKSAFDWDYRPFFLRFHSEDKAERAAAYLELCETIGVDPVE